VDRLVDRLVDTHNIIDSASPEQAFVGEIRIHVDGRNARLRAERGGRGAGGRPPTAAMGADAKGIRGQAPIEMIATRVATGYSYCATRAMRCLSTS